MLFHIDHFVQAWLLPPGSTIILAVIALVIWRFWPLFSKLLLIGSISILWLLSTPLVAQHLINGLQYQYPTLDADKLTHDKKSAIVVLEAGLNLQTPEFGKPTVSAGTLDRLRYAAYLHKKINVPILVSGNDPSNPNINQADYMANALQDFFNVPTQWKEDRGFNTAQEGLLSANILKKAGITKIYLVTHAFHMPRSVYSFQRKNLDVIPAPTAYIQIEKTLGIWSILLPTIDSLNSSTKALHEYIGIYWYRLHYR